MLQEALFQQVRLQQWQWSTLKINQLLFQVKKTTKTKRKILFQRVFRTATVLCTLTAAWQAQKTKVFFKQTLVKAKYTTPRCHQAQMEDPKSSTIWDVLWSEEDF